MLRWNSRSFLLIFKLLDSHSKLYEYEIYHSDITFAIFYVILSKTIFFESINKMFTIKDIILTFLKIRLDFPLSHKSTTYFAKRGIIVMLKIYNVQNGASIEIHTLRNVPEVCDDDCDVMSCIRRLLICSFTLVYTRQCWGIQITRHMYVLKTILSLPCIK